MPLLRTPSLLFFLLVCQLVGSSSVHAGGFSGANTVDVHNKGEISLASVEIGDRVKTAEGRYSPVYSFGHRSEGRNATFLQIYVKGLKEPLEISDKHMLFTWKKQVVQVVQGKRTASKKQVIQAKDIKLGDKLFVVDYKARLMWKLNKQIQNTGYHGEEKIVIEEDGEDDDEFGTVTLIETTQRQGVYAPLTLDGPMVVSGVLVSSYVAPFDLSPAFQHFAAHAARAPHRVACAVYDFTICQNEKYSTEGVSKYLSPFLYVVSKLQLLPTVAHWIVLIVSAPLLGALLWLEAGVQKVAAGSYANVTGVVVFLSLVLFTLRQRFKRTPKRVKVD